MGRRGWSKDRQVYADLWPMIFSVKQVNLCPRWSKVKRSSPFRPQMEWGKGMQEEGESAKKIKRD
jgi:hypothetical protein